MFGLGVLFVIDFLYDSLKSLDFMVFKPGDGYCNWAGGVCFNGFPV